MSMFTPILIHLSRRSCELLLIAEEGRHEDRQRAIARWDAASDPEGDRPGPCLAYAVASEALGGRARRVTLRVESAGAAVDLYYAVCSGTFQIENIRTATRIAEALRDRVRDVDPDMVSRWPRPYEV